MPVIETQYFPSIPFFALWVQEGSIIVEAFEHYQKRSFRNKCQILTAQGLQTLTVPLNKGKHQGKVIADVRINYAEDWQRNHLQTIISSYGRSPFGLFYMDELGAVLSHKYEYLYDLNHAIISLLSNWIGIDERTLNFTSSYESEVNHDFRSAFTPRTLSRVIDSQTDNYYAQVFEEKTGFVPNLSVLDLLMNLGPESLSYLMSYKLP